jgi:hypothetical protein
MLGSLSFQKVKDIYTDEFGKEDKKKRGILFLCVSLIYGFIFCVVGKMVNHISSSN